MITWNKTFWFLKSHALDSNRLNREKATHGLSLHLGSSGSPKTAQKCIFQIGTLIPSASTNAFHFEKFFHVIMFPPIAQFDLSVYMHKPDTTHNSSTRSDEGLTLETSALELFKVANLHYQLN